MNNNNNNKYANQCHGVDHRLADRENSLWGCEACEAVTTRTWTRTQLDVVVVHSNEWCAKLAGRTCRSSSSSSSSSLSTCSHLSDKLTNHPSIVIALIDDAQLLTGQFIVETKPPRLWWPDYLELIYRWAVVYTVKLFVLHRGYEIINWIQRRNADKFSPYDNASSALDVRRAADRLFFC